MTRLLLLIVTITTLTDCARPGDHPISPNCEWIETDHRTLNLATSGDRRHLRFDAVTAEDVAIRWADQHFGRRPEYDQRRQECMETLFTGLAKNHGVDVATVRRYGRQRDIVVDAAVILSFGLIYAGVAYLLAGRIRRRFPPGEPGFWVMALTMSAGVSAAWLTKCIRFLRIISFLALKVDVVRIHARESSLCAGVIPRTEIIQSGFVVPFF